MAQTFKQTLELFGDGDDGSTYSSSGKDFPKSSTATSAKNKKDDALSGSIRENIMQKKSLLNDVLLSADARPEAPKPLIPPEPPKFEPSNPMDAFKSFAPMLAVWGSLATRHPLQTAIGALTAATAAQQKGDAQTYEKKRQQYTDNMEYTMKLHQQQQDEYKDILDSKGKSDTDKLAIIKALAAQNKDELLLHYINAGDIDGVKDVLTNKRTKAGEGLKDSYGNLLPHITPEALEVDAKAIIDGAKLTALGYSTKTTNNPDLWALKNKVAQLNPDFDWAAAQAAYVGKTSEKRAIGTAGAKLKLASNSLDRAIPLAEKALENVDLADYPSLNAVENEARRQDGDPGIVRLNAAIQTVITDYSNLISRSGQATDATRSAARELVNTSMAKGQLEAVFDQMRREKDAQMDALKDSQSDTPKYQINQIIDHGGKKYKVTGNVDSDDPDVELVE